MLAALTTKVSKLKEQMKTMLIEKQKPKLPHRKSGRAVLCNCGGAHSYQTHYPPPMATFIRQLSRYGSQAAAGEFNQGNTNSRPPMIANQIRPPGQRFTKHNSQFNRHASPNFVNANYRFIFGTELSPRNTVTNLKEDLKGITTRSGVAYKGPTIPTISSPKVVERETEVTRTDASYNNGSTEDVQPSPVVRCPS
ncbi:hypothetical protein Tco_0728415 [Tanacetum coccineum]|uniref:Uncharacterized protein n=1 Tax=Tanacetum coccineum TaxID=301880 RepID=A0ABQ4YL34_9ASTR